MYSSPTPYPNLNGLLQEFRDRVSAALGANLTGVYLQGSLAVGDFDQSSDIDFIVVIETDLTDEQVQAINQVHAAIFSLGGRYRPDCPTPRGEPPPGHWETSLEGSYFPRNLLQPTDAPPSDLWYLDNGSTYLERKNHDNTLVARWTLRERGIVVGGPPPQSLVDLVPPGALRQEVLSDMAHIVREFADPFWNSRFGQPYAVFNFCRMLMTVKTGEIHSKRAGVAWAMTALEPRWRPLINRAWAARGTGHVSEPADQAEYAETIAFIEEALKVATRFVDPPASCEY